MEANPQIFKEDYYTGADGTSIYYSLYGHGDRFLILCDGIACDFFVWKYIRTYFHPSFRILLWNLRGHGRSATPKDPRNLTIPDLARDLKGIMDQEGIERGIFVGHSMGVQTMLEFYATYPDRVSALIPLCGSYQYPVDTLRGSRVFRHVLPVIRMLTETFEFPLQLIYSRVLRSELAWVVMYYVELNRIRIRRADMDPYLKHLSVLKIKTFARMLQYASDHSAGYILDRVKVPTLVFAATKDSLTPMYLSEHMHRSISGARMVVLPDGSHAAPVEFPELVNLAMEKFLIEEGFMKTRPRQLPGTAPRDS